jgi:hypothetical protein
MDTKVVEIGTVFGYDFGNVSPIVTLIKSDENDCITLTVHFGLGVQDVMFTEKEFISLLDAGVSLVGGVVWLDREDADSELVGNPPEPMV